MRIFSFIKCMVFVILISIHFSCSEAGLGDFQANKSVDYKLFDLLDDYPSLYDIVNHLDQTTVNLHLSDVVNDRIDEYITNSQDTNRLIGHSDRPVQKTLQKVRNIVNRIINQDYVDYHEPDPETSHANELFQFIDTVRELDLDISGDILSIARKTGEYELDNYDALTVKNLLMDNIDLMLDNDLQDELDSNFEMIGKLLLQADYNIWLAGGPAGTLIQNREDIDPTADYNTGLGNAVQGVNALLMALNSISRDDNVRDDLYNVIREVGNLMGSTITAASGTKGPKEIFKNIIETAEDYFTVGGAQHGQQSVGIPLYNGDPSSTTTFANSELTRLLLAMQVGNLGLLARADRPESLISTVDPTKSISDPEYNNPANKNYVLDRLIKNLRYIEFDPDAANIEETIYDLIRFDTYGRDRKTSGAYATSYLEQFLFLSAASQAGGWYDGGDNDEINNGDDPNSAHGHGMSCEFVTFNDSLFSMGGANKSIPIFGTFNTYNLAFKDNFNNIFRSARMRFLRTERNSYDFGYNQNWAAQKFMSGASHGDVGIPTGGNLSGGQYTDTLNMYTPFTPDGFGDTNMSRYTLYWMVRACWNGEGPYYYDPEKAGKPVETITFDTVKIPRVQLFQNSNYGGYCVNLSAGNYTLSQLRERGVLNDDISSMKVPSGFTVTCYQHDNFDGSSWVFTGDESNMGNRGCNDDVSSLTISGPTTAVNRTYNVYYRPNGQVYMLKSVDPPYDYIYPADGDDPEVSWDDTMDISDYYAEKGVSGKTRERWNRYRSTWYSDFYLITVVDDGFTHWWISPEDLSGGANQAGRFKFDELIAEDYSGRACASQEEAIFRNYQWVMTEKRFAIVVPLRLNAMSCGNGGGFQVVDGNGIAGLTAARKYQSVKNKWAIAGNTSSTSPYPGDYRICLFWKGDSLVPESDIWSSMLTGSVNPPVVAHNAPGVYRFGFPRFYMGSYSDSGVDALGSRVVTDPNSNFGFTVGDSRWNRRNTILPLIVTMLGTIMENQNRNFSDPANRATTLARMKKFTETMMIPILPRFYYRYSQGGTESTVNTWVPRIFGNSADDTMPHHRRIHTRTYEVDTDRSYWGGWKQRNYYQPLPMRTPLNMLYDSDYSTTDGRCDGLLALLTEYDVTQPRGSGNAPKTRLITNALKLLMNLGDEKFDDPAGLDYAAENFDETYPQWGARRKLLYALEQIVSAQKFTKSKVVDILARSPKNITFAAWMFASGTDTDGDGHCDTFSGTRPEDVIVDKSLHSLIGHNYISPTHAGTGLASYPDERNPADPNYEGKSWNLFNDTVSRLGELLSDRGKTVGKYNIIEDVIGIVDKCLAKVNPTESQIRAIVHTVGIVATYYDAGWIYPNDVKIIVTEYLPQILEVSANNPDYPGGENMRMAAELSHEFMRPGGLADYISNTAASEYSSREIFDDIFRFLGDPLISNINSQLWDDIVEMNEGMIEAMLNSRDRMGWELYDDLDFQYNGGYGDLTFDYFGNIGKVFSR